MFSATAALYPLRMLKRIDKYADKSCATSEIEIKDHPSLLPRYHALTTKYVEIYFKRYPRENNRYSHFPEKDKFLDIGLFNTTPDCLRHALSFHSAHY